MLLQSISRVFLQVGAAVAPSNLFRATASRLCLTSPALSSLITRISSSPNPTVAEATTRRIVQSRFLSCTLRQGHHHRPSRLDRRFSTTSYDHRRKLWRTMATITPSVSADEQALLVEKSKRAAAFQAVADYLLPTYRHVGIGSGSTVVHVVDAIAALGTDVTHKMFFYPTGEQSRLLIIKAGLRLAYIQDLPAGEVLDVAFDGADEVDEGLNLIKGGGACLTQEKIVASSSRKFVCVADFRKMSPRLGTAWKQGIPIEVLPMAAERVLAELRLLGSSNPAVRPGLPGKAGPIVTDNGMLIIDAPFQPLLLPNDKQPGVQASAGEKGIWMVDALAQRLIGIVGVAEIGLFHGKNGDEVAIGAQKPVAAYFGMQDGTVRVQKA